jgi:hypothetical protein
MLVLSRLAGLELSSGPIFGAFG